MNIQTNIPTLYAEWKAKYEEGAGYEALDAALVSAKPTSLEDLAAYLKFGLESQALTLNFGENAPATADLGAVLLAGIEAAKAHHSALLRHVQDMQDRATLLNGLADGLGHLDNDGHENARTAQIETIINMSTELVEGLDRANLPKAEPSSGSKRKSAADSETMFEKASTGNESELLSFAKSLRASALTAETDEEQDKRVRERQDLQDEMLCDLANLFAALQFLCWDFSGESIPKGYINDIRAGIVGICGAMKSVLDRDPVFAMS